MNAFDFAKEIFEKLEDDENSLTITVGRNNYLDIAIHGCKTEGAAKNILKKISLQPSVFDSYKHAQWYSLAISPMIRITAFFDSPSEEGEQQ